MITLRTNIASLQASRAISSASSDLKAASEKISSGSRIPNAKEDASGLSIATKLRLDRVALQAARINTQQASSLLQVADGALSEMVNVLDRMNTISVQASSDTISNIERIQLDLEFQLLKSELSRINNTTTFNDQNILGATPEYRLATQGADINTDDGIVGISFENGRSYMQTSPNYDLYYDSSTQIMTIRNNDISFFESERVALPPTGSLEVIEFGELGVNITINEDFDLATDIDWAVDNASFTSQANAITLSTFLPSDIANLGVWFSADDSPLTAPGGIVQTIGDLAVINGGSNNAVQGNAGRRPLLQSNTVFGKSAIVFDGVNDEFIIGNNAVINLGTHTQKSFAMSIRTSTDVTTRQMIYEEGAQVNGINAYIEGGNLYIGVWRSSGGNATFINTPISANADHTFSYSFDSGANAVVGYLDGVQFASVAGIGAALPAHSGGNGLGGVNGSTRNHAGGVISTDTPFNGAIAEVAYYNTVFTPTDHADLDLYLRGNVVSELIFSTGDIDFQVGGGSTDFDRISIDIPDTDKMLDGISNMNVTSAGFAANAIDTIENLVEDISVYRSNIGATMNRLDFAATNLSVSIENLTGAESIIMDADIASEVIKLTASIVLIQVGISMLSAANQESALMLPLLDI